MKTRCKIRFIEFLRPDSYWPYPYSVEQAFGVFGWMCRTAEEFREYGEPGPIELLSGHGTCLNFSAVDPIVTLSQLRNRFHHAILSAYASPSAIAWRQKYSITVDGVKIVPLLHSDRGIGSSYIDGLLSTHGLMKTSLNQFHEKARYCKFVQMRFRGTWRIEMHYGYPGNHGSRWEYLLARQSRREPLSRTIKRAHERLAKLFEGESA